VEYIIFTFTAHTRRLKPAGVCFLTEKLTPRNFPARCIGLCYIALSGRLYVRKFINYRKRGKVEDLAIIQPNPTGWVNRLGNVFN